LADGEVDERPQVGGRRGRRTPTGHFGFVCRASRGR
jgi:hypothetical protein